MLVHHDGHRQLVVLTLHVLTLHAGRSTLLTYVWSQGALGHITPVVITAVVITRVLMTPVLTTPVLLHPYERHAAQEYTPVLVVVLVLLLVWPPPPLHFL